jgi:hypothetical protein
MFFLDLFSVEYKFFCPISAENTMENRAISLVESSRDNSLIACPTSSATQGWKMYRTTYRTIGPRKCFEFPENISPRKKEKDYCKNLKNVNCTVGMTHFNGITSQMEL